MGVFQRQSTVRRVSPVSRNTIAVILVAAVIMGMLTYSSWRLMNPGQKHAGRTTQLVTRYTEGVPNVHEPSGLAPPRPDALAGFTQVYVNDFAAKGVPRGWTTFHGVPGGDPGGQFGPSHVSVTNGVLRLLAARDVHYNNRWVTGGLCQCGFPHMYGAYFVRSRETGPGANEVQLLWPANDQWPPEIDFNESPYLHQTTATVHWGFANATQQWTKTGVNMTSWNTWGVIWTSRYILFVLNGRVWGTLTDPVAIPRLPMRLDLEQRTFCTVHLQCPKAPRQMQVDWIAEYRPN